MQIARPPDGFVITCKQPVAALVDEAGQADARFIQYWDDVLERLKFTAHREGVADDRLGAGHRLFVVEGINGLPRLTLVYLVLGDGVTIKMLRIS